MQTRLHPELQLKADIEADPIYKVLMATFLPDDAAQYRAVLVNETTKVGTLPAARLQARSMLTALATRRLGFADQAAKVAWGQTMADC